MEDPSEITGYTYRVAWSDEDGEYVGLCAEFPSLSWLSPTRAEAHSGIRQLVSDSLADMQATNEAPPHPPKLDEDMNTAIPSPSGSSASGSR